LILQLARLTEPARDEAAPVTIAWHSYAGDAPPAPIRSLNPTYIRHPAELSAVSICFLDLAQTRAAQDVRHLRTTCGDGLYLVAVPRQTDANALAEIFEAGADDVLQDHDAHHVLRCLLRAKRRLALLQAHGRALDALQDKLDAWQEGLDHLPTPIYLKDVGGRYLGCNAAFSQFVGAERDHVLGQTLADFLPKDAADAHWESDLEVMRSGGVIRVETDVCMPDTGMRHIMLHKACVAAPDGGVRGIAGVLIDITERKELEARLTAAAERDPLTNAYNRRKFFQVAASAMEHARQAGSQFAVAVIDIDNFKSASALASRWRSHIEA
jgi:PAS domain S-box-containing protein